MTRSIPSAILLMAGSLLTAAALIGWLVLDSGQGPGDQGPRLRVACAAGIKKPVEEAARLYEQTYGVAIELVYGGSATLLGGLEIKPDSADLYIAADSSYIEDGRRKGLLRESIPMANLTPVIAVRSGNPESITDLDDLLEREELRIGLANPDAAAVGRAARSILRDSGEWDRFNERITVLKPTVVDVANDLSIGSLDAAVIWDATAAQYPEIEPIDDPVFQAGARTIEVAVVDGTPIPTESLRFARFLGARDRGQLILERQGFRPTTGDVWSERPSLVLYAGSMFNQAIEETIVDFSRREGVQIERVYNGCGILTGQMKAGVTPDAYLSCDQRFLDQVSSRFHPAETLTENPMVIVTPRGNPGDVRSVADFKRQGLRIGLAHPEKSALGHLTELILEEADELDAIRASGNWVQEAPQGDFLVNALRTGALDAAIVYASNAAESRDALEIIDLDTGAITARQPWAIARISDHQQTLQRLHAALVDERSADRFRSLGFNWLRPVDDEGSSRE